MLVFRITLEPGVLNEFDELLPPSATRCEVQHASNYKDPRQHQAVVYLVGWRARNRAREIRRRDIQRAVRLQVRQMGHELRKRLQGVNRVVKFGDRLAVMDQHQCWHPDYTILSVEAESNIFSWSHLINFEYQKKKRN